MFLLKKIFSGKREGHEAKEDLQMRDTGFPREWTAIMSMLSGYWALS